MAIRKKGTKTQRKREFWDKDREVMSDYYDLCDRRASKTMEAQLKRLIERDPDFLDTYLLLYDILKNSKRRRGEAGAVLDEAYSRAVKLITDGNSGNWPDVLEWTWLGNRHIIRTILDKAISLWTKGETDGALELFRKLLKTNPGDNVGARHFILAIRMGMSFEAFERRFDKGGFYDRELVEWFDGNRGKFPDEFVWWESAVEEL